MTANCVELNYNKQDLIACAEPCEKGRAIWTAPSHWAGGEIRLISVTLHLKGGAGSQQGQKVPQSHWLCCSDGALDLQYSGETLEGEQNKVLYIRDKSQAP